MSVKFKNNIQVDGYASADYLDLSTTTTRSVDIGEIAWNSTDGTFDMGLIGGVTLQAGQEMHIYGKATEAISNGDAVMFGGVQGKHLLLSKADAATINANPEYFIGVATQNFSTNDFGYVTVFGKVRTLDTTGYSLGAVLYYDSTTSTDGKLTDTEPSAPNAKIIVAAVVRVHATQGVLMVRPHIMPMLSEIQDVNTSLSKTTPVDADNLLLQDSADQSVWKKLSWSNLKATLKAYFDTLYQSVLTNPVTGTGTTNYVSKFTGSTTLGNSQIFDNGTNVGIGITSPSSILHLNSAVPFLSIQGSTTGSLRGINIMQGTTVFSSLSAEASLGETRLSAGFSGWGGFQTFYTNGSEAMRITSAGNVGIGTSSPFGKMTIIDSDRGIDGYGNLNIFTNDSAAISKGGSITFGGNNSTGGTSPYVFAKIQGIKSSEAGSYRGSLRFGTAAASSGIVERMRIDHNGNVGIGTTATSSKLHIKINDNAYGSAMLVENNNSGAQAIAGYNMWCNNKIASINTFSDGALDVLAQDSHIRFRPKGYYSFWINYDTGTSTPRLSIGTSETATHPLRVSSQVSNISIYADYDIVAYSDKSVKENIRPIKNALKRVVDSRGVLYDRTDSGEKNNIGFIAQELEVAFPELVVTNEDGTKAVKYQNAVAVLFEAIKEQQKQIDEIKNILNGNT